MALLKYHVGRCLRVKNKWIGILCIICVIVLVGCQGNNEKEHALEKRITELERQIEDLKKQDTREEEKEPVDGPPVITIVDPNTMNVIHTLFPTDLGYGENFETYKKNIKQLAKELATGKEGISGYDKRMILDRLDEHGNLIKGSPQVILKESELVEKILAVSVIGGNVELPLYVTESGYDKEDIPDIKDLVVASYTTYFKSNDANRNKNIELSAKAINNVIVGSGDYFSFNTVVGPRDEANGYQPAPEIINKKLVMGIGGGICQTSSTLFNAVDQLPLKMVERHFHSLDVGYVPKGRDATVSYGGLDFRFQNTTDAPFIIKTVFGKNSLTVEVRTSAKNKEALTTGLSSY